MYRDYFNTMHKVPWSRFVWNKASMPKSKFILWLLMLNKLKKSKLLKIQPVNDDQCPMYLSNAETVEHMFFKCSFSAKCLTELGNWLHLYTTPQTLADMINFKWKASCFQRKVMIASICSLCYYIWTIKNEAIWLCRMSTVANIMNIVKYEIKIRFSTLYPVQSQTNLWFRDL